MLNKFGLDSDEIRRLPSRCVLTMSRLRFRAIKTNMRIRKINAQAPIAPTINGKNDDCPLESFFTGFIVGWVVVGGDVGSDDQKTNLMKCESLTKDFSTYSTFFP
jgi:hypothetical protein